MKIAAVVILYYPEKETIKNILSYSSLVETVYVMDNSEKPLPEFQTEINKITNCIYLHDNENKGIARRLNDVCEMARNQGYQWLLTMDQDSYFAGDNLTNFLQCLKNYIKSDNIAAFGVQYLNPDSQSSICLSIATNHLITSGSILNLSLFPLIGNFNEELFIDQVDSEYCYRAILKGHRIIQFSNVHLEHSLGKQSTHRSLKSLKKTKRSLHSSLRLYYMTRNYLYMRSKYRKAFHAEIAELRKDLLIRIKNNFLYTSQRFSLLKNVLSGIIDYKKNKMGKK